MQPNRFAVFFLAFAVVGAAACRPEPIVRDADRADATDPGADVAEDTSALDGAPIDAGTDASTDGPVVRDAMLVDSGCPAPERITTAYRIPGYLPLAAAVLRAPIDGDTAHFDVSGAVNQSVRFLFINTEESHGDETTPYGIAVAGIVGTILRDASLIDIAVREDAPGTGRPDIDPYGRWLALVFVDGELIQERIIREGLSPYYTNFGCAPQPVHDALLYSEAEARANQRGLWAPGHPKDYRPILDMWIRGGRGCRPNPYLQPYCR